MKILDTDYYLRTYPDVVDAVASGVCPIAKSPVPPGFRFDEA